MTLLLFWIHSTTKLPLTFVATSLSQQPCKATIATRAQVAANQLALEGVIEEQRVGQRTTLDVLNAQADLINSQILQVISDRNVVVASYAVLSAMGRLSRETLGLQVAAYSPVHHYEQVRDKWIGLRTPDGR